MVYICEYIMLNSFFFFWENKATRFSPINQIEEISELEQNDVLNPENSV